MASSLLISGGSLSCAKGNETLSPLPNNLSKTTRLALVKKSNRAGRSQKLTVSAKQQDGGADFVAGFLIGGAVFGTLAYVFAPQIRRTILNENELGFRRAKRPVYYDEGLEKTRLSLNDKISQLSSAIDNVSARLRGKDRKKTPTVPVENDPEVEATI